MEEYTIDAKGKKIGRVASEAAIVLQDKHTVEYLPNVGGKTLIKINNAAQLDISGKKATEKKYSRYSGYPGGLSFQTMQSVIAQKGHVEVLRRAVYKMLPGNRLRTERMKRLTIVE